MHVLTDTHAPKNNRCLRARISPCTGSNNIRIDPADGSHLFSAELLNALTKLLKVICAGCDEILIDKILINDRMDHGIQKRDVGIGTKLQEMIGMACKLGAPRVHHNQRSALTSRVFDKGGCDRMVAGGVRADNDNNLRMGGVFHLVGDGAGSNSLKKSSDRRRMAKTGTVVHVVCAEACTHEFLKKVRLFVTALCRTEACESLCAELILDGLQALRGVIKRLIPGGGPEHLGRIGRIKKLV